jgi:hypothetical protein
MIVTQQQCAESTHKIEHLDLMAILINTVKTVAGRPIERHIKADRGQQMVQAGFMTIDHNLSE